MKPAILATVLLLANVSAMLASTDPVAQQLLKAAAQQGNLFGGNEPPFQLDVEFSVQASVPAQGHLILKWGAKDRWWRKTVMGQFEQVDIRNGDKLYTSRNISFTPIRIRELFGLLEFTGPSESVVVKKQRQRTHNGLKMTCLNVEQGNLKAKPHDICINDVSQDIMSNEWRQWTNDQLREQYSDHFDFEGYRYPRKLQLLVNESDAITATLTGLITAPFDDALLRVSTGAIERRQCKDMVPPVAVKSPQSAYPVSAKRTGAVGDTTVAMTVLTDGSVTDIQLIGSAGSSPLDESALQALRSWRYKPAMCGAEPVVADVTVIVSVKTY
jgi:TonB family protein